MEAPKHKLTGGEIKFRAMVDDLMVMEKPQMTIGCPNSSKARSLRRMFYYWIANLAEMERNFMSTIEFKVLGRTILVQRKADWQPVEVLGDSNVSNSESGTPGSDRLDDSGGVR